MRHDCKSARPAGIAGFEGNRIAIVLIYNDKKRFSALEWRAIVNDALSI